MSDNKPVKADGSMDDDLPVPPDCLFFTAHKTMKPDAIFGMLRLAIGPGLDVVRDTFSSALRDGAAAAIFKSTSKELQLLPPITIFLEVKSKVNAKVMLDDLKRSLRTQYMQPEPPETTHENIPIGHIRLMLKLGIPADISYAFVRDDLLVMSTDVSALKAVIDTSLGKRTSLAKGGQYAGVLEPISSGSNGRIFLNLRYIATMTKRAAKIYAWQAKITGDRNAEKFAGDLSGNVSALETWHYLGIAFNSDGNRANVRLMMNSE